LSPIRVRDHNRWFKTSLCLFTSCSLVYIDCSAASNVDKWPLLHDTVSSREWTRFFQCSISVRFVRLQRVIQQMKRSIHGVIVI